MPRFLLLLIAVLLVLHQDNWLWANDTLVFGFMPMGLFYHACISLAAAFVWFLATKFCWPSPESLLNATCEAGDSSSNDGENS